MRLPALIVAVLFEIFLPALALAQAPYSPSTWHPYRGGTNCIQVSDSQGNFNCAKNTTVDPVTGNMNISGNLTFGQGGTSAASQFPGGAFFAPPGTTLQVLGGGEFAMAVSPTTIATVGPGPLAATFRIRQISPGVCAPVIALGTQFGEWVIPVLDTLGRVVAGRPCN